MMQFFRPSTDRLNNSHTKLLLRGDAIADASPNARAITNTGTVTSVAASGGHPYAKTAGYFNGSSYITTPNSADFNYSSGAFTIRGWFYLNSLANNQVFVSKYSSGGYQLYIDTTGTFKIWSNATGYSVGSAGQFTTNTWYFISVSSDGTTISVYSNGSLIGTLANTMYEVSAVLSVGNASVGPQANMYCCDVEFSKGASRGGSVPTSPLIADSYTKLHIPMMEYTGQQIVKETVQNKIPTIGSTLALVQHTPATGGPAVDRVLSYSGAATSGLTLPNSTDWQFGSGDFTLEGWFYNSDNGSNRLLFCFRTSSSGGSFGVWNLAGTFAYYLSSSSASWDIANGTTFGSVPLNQWVHISLCRSGSNIRAYVNGGYVTKTVSSASLYNETYPLGIGIGSDNAAGPFNGKIGWAHIVKGTALYTTETSFTPPTSPQQCANTKAIILPGNSPTLFMDKSSSTAPKAITVTGAKQMLLPGGSKSLSFDGSRCLSTPNSSDFNFGSGDFTFSTWFKASDSTERALIGLIAGSGASDGYGFLVFINTSGVGKIAASISYDGASWGLPSTTTLGNFVVGEWCHLALVRKEGNLHCYVNGVRTCTVSSALSIYFPSNIMTVGAYCRITPTYYFNGTMVDTRVVKGQALWTKNFTPPARAL